MLVQVSTHCVQKYIATIFMLKIENMKQNKQKISKTLPTTILLMSKQSPVVFLLFALECRDGEVLNQAIIRVKKRRGGRISDMKKFGMFRQQ